MSSTKNKTCRLLMYWGPKVKTEASTVISLCEYIHRLIFDDTFVVLEISSGWRGHGMPVMQLHVSINQVGQTSLETHR